MSSGTLCPSCGKHFVPPGPCKGWDPELMEECGYVEPDQGLTYTRPRKRSTDERSFQLPAREALARMAPDQLEVNRRGLADARARLELGKARRAGWMRDVVNVETKGRV